MGCRIGCYSGLRAVFWPRHPSLGTPDLLLCFTGPELRPFVLVIEAKLWANKSGAGEQDQLGRYLDILDDLCSVEPSLSSEELGSAFCALLYITPRESIAELLETAALRAAGSETGLRLFRIQWQDIIVAASKQTAEADWIARTILRDVVLKYENVDGGRIESARLIAVPLFSIASIEQVAALSGRLHVLAP